MGAESSGLPQDSLFRELDLSNLILCILEAVLNAVPHVIDGLVELIFQISGLRVNFLLELLSSGLFLGTEVSHSFFGNSLHVV